MQLRMMNFTNPQMQGKRLHKLQRDCQRLQDVFLLISRQRMATLFIWWHQIQIAPTKEFTNHLTVVQLLHKWRTLLISLKEINPGMI